MYIVLAVNSLGLLAVQSLEVWRPGLVDSVIPMTWLWLAAGVFVAAAWLATLTSSSRTSA